ncbi:unnamed protein product [Heterobilharzia americana]|nr:unnamed protein product [Heterobilharzia americana]
MSRNLAEDENGIKSPTFISETFLVFSGSLFLKFLKVSGVIKPRILDIMLLRYILQLSPKNLFPSFKTRVISDCDHSEEIVFDSHTPTNTSVTLANNPRSPSLKATCTSLLRPTAVLRLIPFTNS